MRYYIEEHAKPLREALEAEVLRWPLVTPR